SKNQSESFISLFSWALYDWANSAFFAVIQTFVFATYFMQSVAQNDTIGSAQWGNTIGAAGLVIALCAPFIGAVADQMGRRKPWIGWFTALAFIATAGLWVISPSQQWVFLALILILFGTIGSEFAIVFYNAMLPDLASDRRVGRGSGRAAGLAYSDGLACLVVVLFVFVDATIPPCGLDQANAQHVRARFVLVAVWSGLFCTLFFLFTSHRTGTIVNLKVAELSGWT